MRQFHLLWAAITGGLLSLSAGVQAQNLPIAVSPVVVKMNAATEFSAVLVGNRGDHATGVEVEVFRVQWVDGREQYEATNDFVVSPPTFRLLAKKERLVRFRYSGLHHETEDFYRMFIRQLPEEVVGNQVNMVVNLGVPIFVAPLVSHPALAVIGAAGESKTYTLRNSGNVTLNVQKLEGKNCLQGPQKVFPRLSPGQQVVLNTDMALCATAAQTDQGLVLLTAP